jgi:hypothetical protein
VRDTQEINEAGDIVGRAVVNGAWHAYLLKAVPAGGNSCTPTANSTSIAANSFSLCTEPTPNDAFLFLYGHDQVQLPFGNGARCVGGNPTRLDPPQFSTANLAERRVDLVAEGFSSGSMDFQCWFRDQAAGGAASTHLTASRWFSSPDTSLEPKAAAVAPGSEARPQRAASNQQRSRVEQSCLPHRLRPRLKARDPLPRRLRQAGGLRAG